MTGEAFDLTLGEVTEFINGGAWSADEYAECGMPVVRVSDIKNETVSLSDDRKYLPFGLLEKYRKNILREGDVVVATVGSHPTQPASVVGRAARIPRFADGYLLNQNAVCIRPSDPRLNQAYLRYIVITPKFKQFVAAHARGSANQVRMAISSLSKMSLSLPSITVQERIASILSAYDDLIEANTRRIKILGDMAQMIYREWFVSFRFPGHEKVRMVESELGPIPDGWNTGILRDVCDSIDYGYTDSASLEPIGPKFLRITDIVPSVIDWHRVPYCASPERNPERYALRDGDIVVARTGATTGYAKRFNKKHPPSIFASYLVRLRIKAKFSNHLFGVLVESDDYKKFIQGNWSGAAQPQANAQVLTSIPIVIAPEPLQMRFSALVEPLFDLKEALHFKNLNLRTTRDLLLPKLISGEISVEVAGEAAAEIMEEVALHA